MIQLTVLQKLAKNQTGPSPSCFCAGKAKLNQLVIAGKLNMFCYWFAAKNLLVSLRKKSIIDMLFFKGYFIDYL
ncbi:hypothetical protein LguiB_009040 [Lonicera macranthoides]